ncbi:MAG: hypothetical protein Q7T39_22075 [Polaromonas sp.]|nr:hypothetical protein [Polaromonas sp.]
MPAASFVFNVKARMTSWFLLFLAFVFAGLAYDALNLAVPVKDVLFSVTAKALGLPHENVSLVEQERRKQWNNRYGLGDLSQIFWLWAVLSLACALAGVVDFL